MGVVLFNPTDGLEEKFQETFIGHHMGTRYDIKPGQKLKVTDKAGSHFKNEFAARGLVFLDFGDDPEEQAKIGLERNRAFKVKQINDFNEKNSANKHRGLPYLWPTPTLKVYAQEIGVKLVESYQVDDAQLQKVKMLEEENLTLKTQIGEMNEKLNQVLEQITKPEAKDDEEKKGPGRPKKEG